MLDKKIIKNYVLISVMIFILINPQLMVQSVKNGMLICYNNVIPSLYIFMVLANYRAKPEIMEIISFPLRWYGKLMKIDDNYFSGCLAVSLLGGFAVGAQYINNMKKRGYSDRATEVLSIAVINNSLSFCIFAVGLTGFGSTSIGLILYISLIISSMITAFLFSFFKEYNIVLSPENTYTEDITFVKSIKKSVENILVICGFVIFFNLLCEVFSLYTYKNNFLDCFVAVFLEVTCGVLKILSNYNQKIYFICFALSIFPICTLCQVYHFTGDRNIIKTLLLSRLIHTPLSILILTVILNLFPTVMVVNSTINTHVSFFSRTPEVSSAMFMITVVFILIFDKNKLFTKSE